MKKQIETITWVLFSKEKDIPCANLEGRVYAFRTKKQAKAEATKNEVVVKCVIRKI